MAKRRRKGAENKTAGGKGAGGEGGGDAAGSEETYWQKVWDARQAILEARLGPAEETIQTSLMPIYLGGQCDVLTFRKHVKGYTYCTAGLTVTSDQKRSKLGQYEMLMCTRRADNFVPGLLSNLSRYTLDNPINARDTIDMGEEQPKGVTLRALLALEFDPPRGPFTLMGRKCGLLLLAGITAAELVAFRSGGSDEVLARLGEKVLPYTDPRRKSVV